MMLDHLRHTLFPLSAGLLLFSCSTDQPDAPQSEMKFDISTVSRSSVTTKDNIIASPFAVFGDRIATELATDASEKSHIIYNNIHVKYVDQKWVTQSDPQYWYNNYQHSFVAIHPADAVSNADAKTQYSNSTLSFSYTLPSNITETIDLLAATHRRNYSDKRQYDNAGNLTSGEAGVVFMEFGHIMTQINFAVALSDNTSADDSFIEISKIEFSRCSSVATFNVVPAQLTTSDKTDDRQLDVTDHGIRGNFIIEYSEPIKIYNDRRYLTLFDYDDALIMLPQTFAADTDAEIIFSYTTNGETAIKQVVLPLKSQQWDTGRSYTYRFTIGSTGPHFESPTITDWNERGVGNIDAH